jgi:hypothetical protein
MAPMSVASIALSEFASLGNRLKKLVLGNSVEAKAPSYAA